MKSLISLLATITCLMAIPIDATTLVQSKLTTLPTSEISILENLACLTPHKLKAETITARKNLHTNTQTSFHSAFIKCQSHGVFMGAPMNYQAYCYYENSKWECPKIELEATAQLNGRAVQIHPNNISVEAAYEFIRTTSSYGMFQGISLNEAIGSSCNVSQSDDHETVKLDCKYAITLSFWCPQPQLTTCPRVVSVNEYPLY